MKDYKQLLPLFKEWFELQFQSKINCSFDEKTGFADEQINILRIGFCGGWLIRESQK